MKGGGVRGKGRRRGAGRQGDKESRFTTVGALLLAPTRTVIFERRSPFFQSLLEPPPIIITNDVWGANTDPLIVGVGAPGGVDPKSGIARDL